MVAIMEQISDLEALYVLYKAFLSRHGCFPIDRVNDATKQWNDAMKIAREKLVTAGFDVR